MVLAGYDMEQCMKDLIWHLEVPRVGQSYPNYYASKLASKFCKVVLTGTGGDELFVDIHGGIIGQLLMRILTIIVSIFQILKRMIRESTKNFSQSITTKITHMNFLKGYLKSIKVKNYPKDYKSFACLEAKTFLVGLLEIEDKLAMSHGLESRVPFLDNDLVELPPKFQLALNWNLRL